MPVTDRSNLTSAQNHRAPRVEVEVPHKAALAYRCFVREAVRRCVLEWKRFDPEGLMLMAEEAGIPTDDRASVVDHVEGTIRGLHEGNLILYRLHAVDLVGLRRP